MSDEHTFRPLPEPEPPNFEGLPLGTREVFERRLDFLPIQRIRTSVGAWAIIANESRAMNRYEIQNNLEWHRFAPLGTWHMRAVHDRISAARPDLLPPRRPSGVYSGIRAQTRSDRTRHRLVDLHLWNFLDGTYTWLRNRAVDLRAASLRLSVRN
jgi:hypothetical protein